MDADLKRFLFHPGRWAVCLLLAASIWGVLDVRGRGYIDPNAPVWEHRTDLTVYTEAGAAFFDGRHPYEVANPRGWTYLYPPLFALLLAPLHALAPENQVTVWFVLGLAFSWGCYRECGRLLAVVCREDERVAATWARWFPWLGLAAVATAALPTLNCLQRGQVGVVKLYLLLLGVRCILGGRSYVVRFAGGMALALAVVFKILPALPVGFVLLALGIDWLRKGRSAVPTGARLWASSLGVAAGLVLFLLVVPAAMIGWKANLRHLNTWGRFMLTKADDGGMDPRSGNSHSARNQSLQNGAYRLGNFAAYAAGLGPDDRLVEYFDAPRMAMDTAAFERCLFTARAALGLALIALSFRLIRGHGNALNVTVVFALACVAMLVISPVARGHYFMLLAPAVLFVPLWLDREVSTRSAAVMAGIPLVVTVLHYAMLPVAGRIGWLGLGTATWLIVAMVLMARVERRGRTRTECDSGNACRHASPATATAGRFPPAGS